MHVIKHHGNITKQVEHSCFLKEQSSQVAVLHVEPSPCLTGSDSHGDNDYIDTLLHAQHAHTTSAQETLCSLHPVSDIHLYVAASTKLPALC